MNPLILFKNDITYDFNMWSNIYYFNQMYVN